MSIVEDRVIQLIKKRQDAGKEKYGVTMERTDLSLRDWHQHKLEELLDAAIYSMRIIMDLDGEFVQEKIQPTLMNVKQSCRNCCHFSKALPGEYEYCEKAQMTISNPMSFYCNRWEL